MSTEPVYVTRDELADLVQALRRELREAVALIDHRLDGLERGLNRMLLVLGSAQVLTLALQARCPKCGHYWVSHGVPTEDDYGCLMPTSSMDERKRGIFEVCGCTFAEGNPVMPRQVRIWTDGTSWPVAPWDRADCGHRRRGPVRPDDSQQCLDCGVVLVSDG